MLNNVAATSEPFDALACHKDRTDSLNLVGVANDFIVGIDHMKHEFGTEF